MGEGEGGGGQREDYSLKKKSGIMMFRCVSMSVGHDIVEVRQMGKKEKKKNKSNEERDKKKETV